MLYLGQQADLEYFGICFELPKAARSKVQGPKGRTFD